MSFDKQLPSGQPPQWGFVGVSYSASAQMAQSGSIRGPNGVNVFTCKVRANNNTQDVTWLTWDSTANSNTGRFIFGPDILASVWIRVPSGNSISFRSGSGQMYGFSGTALTIGSPLISFVDQPSSDPTITQAANAGNVTGQRFRIFAQATAAQAGNLGGGVDIGAGAATAGGTNGKNRLRNAGDNASMLEWNDVGLGFFGTVPQAKPAITGSRTLSDPVALSILAAGVTLGLWTDSTSP